jgi:hypothetical protein
MAIDRIPGPGFARQRENAANDHGPPTEIAGQFRRKTSLPVHRREKILQVRDRRLDFHGQQSAACRVPGKHVDRPLLSPLTEGVFRDHLPPRGVQSDGHRLNQRRVPLVQQFRQLRTAPSRIQTEGNAQDGRDLASRPERGRVQRAALDQGDQRSTDARERRDLGLAQAAPDPHRSKDRTHPCVIHGGIMGKPPSLGLNQPRQGPRSVVRAERLVALRSASSYEGGAQPGQAFEPVMAGRPGGADARSRAHARSPL